MDSTITDLIEQAAGDWHRELHAHIERALEAALRKLHGGELPSFAEISQRAQCIIHTDGTKEWFYDKTLILRQHPPTIETLNIRFDTI